MLVACSVETRVVSMAELMAEKMVAPKEVKMVVQWVQHWVDL